MLPLWLAAAMAAWPELDAPDRVGGGGADAALVVGVEDYWVVPDVPGARRNARDWAAWFTEGRGVAPERVRLLLDGDATAEEVRAQAAHLAAEVGPDGYLWIVWIGHGAPDPAGGGGALLGVDVQPTAQSLAARGVSRAEPLAATAGADRRVFVFDACFSGRTPTGADLAPGLQLLVPNHAAPPPGVTELTASALDELAGPLPREHRPAFSYLLLGALHGWGDADGDGAVTAAEAVAWTRGALGTVVLGRTQTPQLHGDDRPLAAAGRSARPDLAEIASQTSEDRRGPAAPPSRPGAPSGAPPALPVDVEAAALLAAARAAAASPVVSPARTAAAWCALVEHGAPETLALAEAECAAWTSFDDGQRSWWGAFFDDWDRTDRLLGVDGAPVEARLAAVDHLRATYGPLSPWADRRLARVRARVADDRARGLPDFFHPPEWAWKAEPRRGAFWGWDPRVAQHPWLDFTLGGGTYADPAFAEAVIGGEVGYGPAVVTASYGIGARGRGTVGATIAVAPLVARPSLRLTAERRGSWLNPSLGAGVRYATSPGEEKVWVEAHAANHLWLSTAIGLRLEGRLPMVGGGHLGPGVFAALVLDQGRLAARAAPELR
jgi:hypothetical protein